MLRKEVACGSCCGPRTWELGIGGVFLKEEQGGTLGWTQSHSNIFAHLNKNKCLSSVSIFSYVLYNNKGGKQILKIAITLIRNLEIQTNGEMFCIFSDSWSVYSPLREKLEV